MTTDLNQALHDDDFLRRHVARTFVIVCPRCGRYGVVREKDSNGWYRVVWRDPVTLPEGKVWEDLVLPQDLLLETFGCGYDDPKRLNSEAKFF